MPSIIKNGVVVATASVIPDAADMITQGVTAIPEDGEIGQLWDGVKFTDPAPAVINTNEITKRQLYLQLIADGKQSEWDSLMTMLAGDAHNNTVFTLTTGLTITDPLVQLFSASFGYTGATLQALWNRASKQ